MDLTSHKLSGQHSFSTRCSVQDDPGSCGRGWTRAGQDRIFGWGGADVICGGAGPDVVLGVRGNDHIRALSGADLVRGKGGADVLFARSDPLFSREARAGRAVREGTLRGGGGRDFLVGFAPAVVLLGGVMRGLARTHPSYRVTTPPTSARSA